MSAVRNIHPDQLRMLVPAGEIHDKWAHMDQSLQDSGSIMNRKLEEAKVGDSNFTGWSPGDYGETLVDSVRSDGIISPVGGHGPREWTGGRPALGNGHHRVAAANYLNPKTEVPVEWHS